MSQEVRPNPFKDRGEWFWRDENDVPFGPYKTQTDALIGLMRCLDKRSRWVRLKEVLAEFVHA